MWNFNYAKNTYVLDFPMSNRQMVEFLNEAVSCIVDFCEMYPYLVAGWAKSHISKRFVLDLILTEITGVKGTPMEGALREHWQDLNDLARSFSGEDDRDIPVSADTLFSKMAYLRAIKFKEYNEGFFNMVSLLTTIERDSVRYYSGRLVTEFLDWNVYRNTFHFKAQVTKSLLKKHLPEDMGNMYNVHDVVRATQSDDKPMNHTPVIRLGMFTTSLYEMSENGYDMEDFNTLVPRPDRASSNNDIHLMTHLSIKFTKAEKYIKWKRRVCWRIRKISGIQKFSWYEMLKKWAHNGMPMKPGKAAVVMVYGTMFGMALNYRIVRDAVAIRKKKYGSLEEKNANTHSFLEAYATINRLDGVIVPMEKETLFVIEGSRASKNGYSIRKVVVSNNRSGSLHEGYMYTSPNVPGTHTNSLQVDLNDPEDLEFIDFRISSENKRLNRVE